MSSVKKQGHISLECREIGKLRENLKLCPQYFCVIHGGLKNDDCKSNKCLGAPTGRSYTCRKHKAIWWPLCKVESVCGVEQHEKWLEQKMACEVKAENLQQQDSSIVAIGPAQTNNNTGCTDSNAIIANPGAAFFQTEYASAISQEGNLVPVVISYDSMSSLSVGSKLEGLNHNPKQITTPPLPIKTLYSVT